MFNISNIGFLFLIPFLLSLIILLINLLLSARGSNLEKLSAYECGFSPFGNARMAFNVHYYLVAIFYILFDLEIVFLVPFSYSYCDLSFISVVYALIFLFFLGVGFFYEWINQTLDW